MYLSNIISSASQRTDVCLGSVCSHFVTMSFQLMVSWERTTLATFAAKAGLNRLESESCNDKGIYLLYD